MPPMLPVLANTATSHVHEAHEARDIAGGATNFASSGDANEDVGITGNTAANAISLLDRNSGNQPYTVTFISSATDTRSMVVWNKVGSDGLPSSGSFVEKAVTTKFDLAPGETKVVAFQPNTQAGFCDWTDQKTTASGQFSCGYGEVNMAPKAADGQPGWSAADVSTYTQSASGNGKGAPCNLNIGATGSVTPNSTCSDNYYYTAAGSGLPNGLGVIVNNPSEAHFFAQVSNPGVSS